MELLPILDSLEKNKEFADNPYCLESLVTSINYYNRIGYHPPWIGYYARKDNQLVGTGGFKGAPFKGRVEIAYGTFDRFRRQGVGTELCAKLVELSLKTDPTVLITARTLPQKNFSTRILEKNDFEWLGTVQDIDDGEVWEWVLRCLPASRKPSAWQAG